MKNPKPLTCYAIINTKKPILKLIDLYESEDVELGKDEIIIRVVITVKK